MRSKSKTQPTTLADLLQRRLRELRARQRDLVAELRRIGVDVSPRTVSAWCRGAALPDPGQRLALALVFVVPLAERPQWLS